ncbi:MAG TPA: hypothetical protein VLF68_01285 [Candidatus Saccharimonadales bacterium]|nr:hypothetical protein [Candidatus Saccharimonadales bacterium]
MDKKALDQMDPKLRETYERVMGTTVAAPSVAPASQPTEPAPMQTPAMPASPASPIIDSEATRGVGGPTVQPAEQPQPAPPQSFAPQSNVVHLNQGTGMVMPKKKSGFSPVLYIIGGVVFLAVYAFIWMKIFNITF